MNISGSLIDITEIQVSRNIVDRNVRNEISWKTKGPQGDGIPWMYSLYFMFSVIAVKYQHLFLTHTFQIQYFSNVVPVPTAMVLPEVFAMVLPEMSEWHSLRCSHWYYLRCLWQMQLPKSHSQRCLTQKDREGSSKHPTFFHEQEIQLQRTEKVLVVAILSSPNPRSTVY